MTWMPGWAHRKSHVINSASGAGTGYQVRSPYIAALAATEEMMSIVALMVTQISVISASQMTMEQRC